MPRRESPLPKARQDGLVVRELPDEVLVYDLKRHRAHCLGGVAAEVWKRCDGKTSPVEIGRAQGIDPGVTNVALRRLQRARLLDVPAAVTSPALPRRELMKRIAAIGGLSVLSITVPTPVFAASSLSCAACESIKNSSCPGVPCSDGPNKGSLCLSGGGGKCCTCGGGGKVQCGGAC
jgi:hypothetical protein